MKTTHNLALLPDTDKNLHKPGLAYLHCFRNEKLPFQPYRGLSVYCRDPEKGSET